MVPLKAGNGWNGVEPRVRRAEGAVGPPKMVRPVPTVLLPMVEEAVERNPLKKPKVVEVDCVPSLCLVKGKENVDTDAPPPPPPTQVPLIEKQPAERLKPFPAVVVAEPSER